MLKTNIHRINCGTILAPTYPTVVCHCFLLEDPQGLALVDTGIGLLEVKDPRGRLGPELAENAGFQFHESDTAVRRIEKLGYKPSDVKDIILTHCDPDHAGGLADFPQARVHVAAEELVHARSGHQRYVPRQFEHRPHWETYGETTQDWFGLAARRVRLNFAAEVLLVPLFGHTLGHCGVAVEQDGDWVLHAGDAYYLRVELERDDHPVSELATQRADDNEQRLAALKELRRLHTDHRGEITMNGYHDITELPAEMQVEVKNLA